MKREAFISQISNFNQKITWISTTSAIFDEIKNHLKTGWILHYSQVISDWRDRPNGDVSNIRLSKKIQKFSDCTGENVAQLKGSMFELWEHKLLDSMTQK